MAFYRGASIEDGGFLEGVLLFFIVRTLISLLTLEFLFLISISTKLMPVSSRLSSFPSSVYHIVVPSPLVINGQNVSHVLFVVSFSKAVLHREDSIVHRNDVYNVHGGKDGIVLGTTSRHSLLLLEVLPLADRWLLR